MHTEVYLKILFNLYLLIFCSNHRRMFHKPKAYVDAHVSCFINRIGAGALIKNFLLEAI